MYKEKITELISLNDIDDNEFHEKLFRTLLLGVFETICKEMKKQNKNFGYGLIFSSQSAIMNDRKI